MPDEQSTWPVPVEGVLETVITTRQPDGAWNAAALGITGPPPVTATTWGRTRTRNNLERDGHGYVQFVRDPVVFVTAALEIHESSTPILDPTAAWVEITVTHRDEGTTRGTSWIEWELTPEATEVIDRYIPIINRGFNAVIEASVAASRLDVPAYDTDELLMRIRWLASIVDRCGAERDQEAFTIIKEHTRDHAKD